MVRQRASIFPDPRSADATGLVAVTERLDARLLLEAYQRGIFPWSEHPVRWYSPDPRAIFVREHIRIPRRLGRIVRKNDLRVSCDQAFEAVMRACADAHRADGEWISEGFVHAYRRLHQQGFAHSVEVWQGERLVGGIYGVQIGGLFAGESMFYRVPNASKVAFAYLVGQLDAIGTLLFDAQVINPFTEQLGAVLVRRALYLRLLAGALTARTLFEGESWPAEPLAVASRIAS